MTPVRRLALLLGPDGGDFALVVALSVPVAILGLLLGVEFATGLAGMVVFVLLAGAGVGLASMTLAFLALRGRVRRG